jgi:hypothetical protein
MGESENMLWIKVIGLLLFSVGGFGTFVFFVSSLQKGFEESLKQRKSTPKDGSPSALREQEA